MIALASYCDNWSPQCCTETVNAMRRHESNVMRAANRYKAAVFFRIREHRSLNHREISDELLQAS